MHIFHDENIAQQMRKHVRVQRVAGRQIAGEADNAGFLQGVFNNSGAWLLQHIIDCIYTHRGEGGTIAPWMVTSDFNDIWKDLAENRGFGYIQVSDEYLDWFDRFSNAHSIKLTEDWLQKRYGFGLDDLLFERGVLSGRTDEITTLINNDDWLKRQRDEIIKCIQLPRDNDISTVNIIFENGRFSIEY